MIKIDVLDNKSASLFCLLDFSNRNYDFIFLSSLFFC